MNKTDPIQLKALKKAIRIAVKNGWEHGKFYLANERDYLQDRVWRVKILFSHEFAKSLWGDIELVKDPTRAYGMMPKKGGVKSWKHHLQQMVLYEDPLDYLVEYLGKEKA